jgi:hypothetical protein
VLAVPFKLHDRTDLCYLAAEEITALSPERKAQPPGNPVVQWLAARCDQAGFIGQHDGLDSVAQAQLGEYPSDMDFYGSFGQLQFGGDLAVGSPGGPALNPVRTYSSRSKVVRIRTLVRGRRL